MITQERKRVPKTIRCPNIAINGIKIHPSVDDVARVGLVVAAGEMKYEDLPEWILENK